jgi:P-type Ca2+ transporter type 2C
VVSGRHEPKGGMSSVRHEHPTSRPAPEHSLAWYRLPVAEVERRLQTTLADGLSHAGVVRRLAQYGPNEVQERGGPSRWQILVGQLTGVMTLVLFAAAGISVVLGDLLDAVVILAIVMLNAALG